MYSDILEQIGIILATVTEPGEVFGYPNPNPTKNPYAVYFPDTLANAFETTTENAKEYNFKLWIVVSEARKTPQQVWEEDGILPNAVDAVLQAFDTGWSDQIGSHRVRLLIDVGEWGRSEENKSKESYAEFNIIVKVLTDN